ncbi:hypothetical protein LOK74_23650 [Brevibacillus humidisoli]|uniref:hypothetical protein n=1 Tax=Brevibacillus humidisoli TaxID=2895522 RepID=UPI001E33A0FF|nr:hypothetical protein [Brevibacillus humidisoli]UFJ40943.1 hypothetical protein LOK74_23650 [Brevibacillus humidisoli]
MKKRTEEVLFQAEASYKDLLLRKNMKLRIWETAVFVVGMVLLSVLFGSQSNTFKLLAFAIAFGVVGLSPFLYKAVLRPRYTLTKSHLIVSIAGQERSYPLSAVEQVYEGRNVYRLQGKKESLMISREFLAHLDERLFLLQRKGKRR